MYASPVLAKFGSTSMLENSFCFALFMATRDGSASICANSASLPSSTVRASRATTSPSAANALSGVTPRMCSSHTRALYVAGL